MSTIDTAEFEQRLREERERVEQALEHLRSEHTGSLTEETGELADAGTDNHLGDLGTETFERELDEGLAEGDERRLQEIDAALQRIDDGSYGRCAVDGGPIPLERLRAVPWATLCIDHQREQEQG